MTGVYITIDTEYSSGMVAELGTGCRAENFARTIACRSDSGEAGIDYQMDVFDRHDMKAVFFVDPMPALVWGTGAIADVVRPIVARGHDVQLHIHTEWLEWAGAANPLGEGRTGRNMADFTLAEQLVLLAWAKDTLVAAGAPAPVAFRAGNYGANDDTLRALAHFGLRYDSSHCPALGGEISLGRRDRRPVEHCGVVEVPAGCIRSFGDELRHAQITALSAKELLCAVRHARDTGLDSFTVVSHSFELFNRDAGRINPVLKRRFERFIKGLAAMEGVHTATFAGIPPEPLPKSYPPRPVLPHSPLRTGLRVVEQAVANVLHTREWPRRAKDTAALGLLMVC